MHHIPQMPGFYGVVQAESSHAPPSLEVTFCALYIYLYIQKTSDVISGEDNIYVGLDLDGF